MADEPPPGDAIWRSCSRVNTPLMFWEGAISSSESLAPFRSVVLNRGVPEIVFSFQTLWIWKELLPMCCSRFMPHDTKVVRGPWLLPLVNLGARTAPISCNLELKLARRKPLGLYPNPDLTNLLLFRRT